MKHPLPALSATLGATFLLAAVPASAQAPAPADTDQIVTKDNPDVRTNAGAYWTADRFKAARPMPFPSVQPEAVRVQPQSATAAPRPESTDGQPPSHRSRITARRLYMPDAAHLRSGGEPERRVVEPQANGSYSTPYTSTRVFPQFSGSGTAYSADRAYPYTTVGKLFFTVNGSPYVCSAAVIQRRVVATAGHCVHSGATATGFYANWVFVPAFRDGVAPLKQWNWRHVAVTSAWATGGGGVPNGADYAMLEFADQPMSAGGTPVKLGNVTGWLGWQTASLDGNHTSKLGYPCNLDSCQKMQNVTSSSYRATSPNNVEYASDARGGSSGGPWVQNFATVPAGGGTGSNPGLNRLVGITSYGYVSEEPKVQGASIPDSRWIALWNSLCSRSGNCN